MRKKDIILTFTITRLSPTSQRKWSDPLYKAKEFHFRMRQPVWGKNTEARGNSVRLPASPLPFEIMQGCTIATRSHHLHFPRRSCKDIWVPLQSQIATMVSSECRECTLGYIRVEVRRMWRKLQFSPVLLGFRGCKMGDFLEQDRFIRYCHTLRKPYLHRTYIKKSDVQGFSKIPNPDFIVVIYLAKFVALRSLSLNFVKCDGEITLTWRSLA